jgi:hypothetical protein
MSLSMMVMDGAGRPKAKALRVPDDMALVFLPPYSPQLNPVEHIWESIRENWFNNEVFNSIGAVEDQLEKALAAIEGDPTSVKGITGFPWIISMNSCETSKLEKDYRITKLKFRSRSNRVRGRGGLA